MQEHKKQM